MNRLVLIPVLIIGLLLVSNVEADADAYTMDELVVRGTPEGMDVATASYEIGSREIAATPAKTVDEILNLFSSVTVRTGPEGVPRVEMRGFRSRQILFMLDGVPLNSGFDQQFDPTLIPLESVEKIQITAGAGSVLNGQGGLGGVINIITKKAQQGSAAFFGFESGEGQPFMLKANVSHGMDSSDVIIGGSMYKRNYFPVASPFTASIVEGQGYRTNSDATRNSFYGNFGYRFGDHVKVRLITNYVTGNYGKPASAINNTFDPFAPAARYGRVEDYDTVSARLALDYLPDEKFSLSSTYYFNYIKQLTSQYDDDTYTTINNPFIPNSYSLWNTAVTNGITIKPKVDFNAAGTVTFSLTGEWNDWHDSGLVKTGSDGGAGGGHGIGGGSPPYTLFSVSDKNSLALYSAAVEYEVLLRESLRLVAGLASYWQRQEVQNDNAFGANLALRYELSAAMALKAAFQKNIRFPSLSQLFLRDSNNPYLKPETVYHYQVGGEARLPAETMLSLNGFYSDAYDLIVLDQTVTPNKFRNYSHYRFYGGELAVESRPVTGLSLRTSYTFLQSQDLSGQMRDEVQYIPRDRFAISAQYDFNFGLTIFASTSCVANSYVYTKNTIVPPQKAKMKDYTLTDVKVTQSFLNKKLSFSIGATNLFNEDYEQTYGIPRPGRYIFGSLEVRL